MLLLTRLCCAIGELLSRSLNSEPPSVQKLLDLKNHFNILASVESMAGTALDRLERGKLGLPITQDVGLGFS